MLNNYLHTVIQLGSLYAFIALAVCVSFRYLSFPDLTIDGSFVLGGVITARAITAGFGWSMSLGLALLAGLACGVWTATLHRVFGVNKFFAGVLSAMMLYSLNLRLLGGANLSIRGQENVFSWFSTESEERSVLCIGLALLGTGFVILSFHTSLGLRLRGLGSNPQALRLGQPGKFWLTALGLAVANVLAAIGGSLVAQYQRFVDVNMGLGVAINGFAALFLGEAAVIGLGVLSRWKRSTRTRGDSFPISLALPVFGEAVGAAAGALLLLAVVTGSLYFGFPPSDLKAIAAGLMVLGMVMRRRRTSSLLEPVSRFEQ